jgi:DNA-binding GntR family transcriptional regulator
MSSTERLDEDEPPVRRVPAVERVLDHILEEMDAGHLQPGGRVNAARIAATLELSVAPVREALSILSGRGVVELLQDRGAIMRQLTPNDVIKVWQVVIPIGAVGLQLAASAIASGADSSTLVEKYAAIRDNPRAIPAVQFLIRTNEYHWAAHDIARNRYVTLAMDCLGVPYWDRYIVKYVDVQANLDGYLSNYRRMHEAVMAGDGPAAGEILRFHAHWSMDLIRKRAMEAVPLLRQRRPKAGAARG